MTQALYSSDSELLEKVLHISNRKTIYATVKRLSPTLVLTLVDECVIRLQKKPNRASVLIEWIRASLLHHSGYLQSVSCNRQSTQIDQLYIIVYINRQSTQIDQDKDKIANQDKISNPTIGPTSKRSIIRIISFLGIKTRIITSTHGIIRSS